RLNWVPEASAWLVRSLEVAPASNDNSVSELPNSPFDADSQITTEIVSPTAIFSSGGGTYFLNRSAEAGRGCASKVSTTESSILTTSKAILPPRFACASMSLPSKSLEQAASVNESRQTYQTERFIGAQRTPTFACIA